MPLLKCFDLSFVCSQPLMPSIAPFHECMHKLPCVNFLFLNPCIYMLEYFSFINPYISFLPCRATLHTSLETQLFMCTCSRWEFKCSSSRIILHISIVQAKYINLQVVQTPTHIQITCFIRIYIHWWFPWIHYNDLKLCWSLWSHPPHTSLSFSWALIVIMQPINPYHTYVAQSTKSSTSDQWPLVFDTTHTLPNLFKAWCVFQELVYPLSPNFWSVYWVKHEASTTTWAYDSCNT